MLTIDRSRYDILAVAIRRVLLLSVNRFFSIDYFLAGNHVNETSLVCSHRGHYFFHRSPRRELSFPNSTRGARRYIDKLASQFAKADVGVTFSSVAGAVAYRGQVALDAAFTNLIADASANEPSLVFKDLPDGEFFVRARAIDSLGLEGRDAVRSLRVAARPFAPALQLPLDNTHVDSGAVRFV